MAEKRIPYGSIAGFIVAAGLSSGMIKGANETNPDDTISYGESVHSQGLTLKNHTDLLSAREDISDARHKLEYTPPNTICNVRILDVSLGGCEAEKFPEVDEAVKLLNKAEEKLSHQRGMEFSQSLEAVEESILKRDEEFRIKGFEEPINQETFSHERFELNQTEEKIEEMYEAVDKRALDASRAPVLPFTLLYGGVVSAFAAAGFGGSAAYKYFVKS